MEGEIAVLDKAYVHFQHLFALSERGVNWVTRAKDNMGYHVCKKRKVSEVSLTIKQSKGHYELIV